MSFSEWVQGSAWEQLQQRFKKSKAARYDARIAQLRTPNHHEASKNDNPAEDADQLETHDTEFRSPDPISQADIDEDWQRCFQDCPAILDELFDSVEVGLPVDHFEPPNSRKEIHRR
jgi:hypothetical protein